MSLYNMLFGMNSDADKILGFLGKTREDFGRFRNVYMEDGYIVVHTRCGGGNREDYESVFDEMREHPWYSHDADEDFDCTYADISRISLELGWKPQLSFEEGVAKIVANIDYWQIGRAHV